MLTPGTVIEMNLTRADRSVKLFLKLISDHVFN